VGLIDRVDFLISKKQNFTFSLTDENYLMDALKMGKGAIILSGHIGNWEIAGNYLYDVFKLNINIVMMDNEHKNIKKIFKNIVSKRRFKIITLTENGIDFIIHIKKALQNNEIVCFHGDRTVGSSGVRLPFLGKSASFPDGPFHIAAVTNSPIIPFFLVKEGFNHYCTKVFKPLVIQYGSKEKRNGEITAAMKSYVEILEKIVKNYPYQWFNFYNYWNDVN
jgi:predicted LPLAT superfamily acyltransferase